MKLRKYIKSHALVLVLILPIACSRNESDKTSTLSYSYRTVERAYPDCRVSQENKECVRLEYRFPVFGEGEDLPVADSLSQAVAWFIFDEAKAPLTQDTFDRLARSWYQEYDSTKSAIEGYNLPWEQQIDIRIIRQTDNYLTVEFAEQEYSGGAHGNELKMYRMFRIPTGERLRLSDILSRGTTEEELAAVAEPDFRELKKLPDDVEYDERNYFFKEGAFALNDNYALTDKGLLFHYNPYEIAPYSEGPTRLVIPYNRIDSLLAAPFLPSSAVNKN